MKYAWAQRENRAHRVLERGWSVRLFLPGLASPGPEGEDKGPGLLESLAWGRRACRAPERPGGVRRAGLAYL